MKKWCAGLAIAALAAVSCIATATSAAASPLTYYVSPTGSDTASGTSSTTPFQHIARCSAMMVAGDTCVLLPGTYHETVTPATSGSSTAPITYRASSPGAATIDGADPVDGWSTVTSADLTALEAGDAFLAGSGFATAVAAGHVFKASADLDAVGANRQVFSDGTMAFDAQWPDPGALPSDRPFKYAGTGTTNTAVHSTDLTQPSGYWNGANIQLTTWYLSQTGKVATSPTGELDLTDLEDAGLCIGLKPTQTTYYLSGKLSELSTANEWYYDSPTRTLYFYPPAGTAPATGQVTAKARNLAFDLSSGGGVSYTTISGLDIHASSIQTGTSSTGVVIDGVHASYVSHTNDLQNDSHYPATGHCGATTAGLTTTGILLNGTGNTISNSEIAFSSGNGVALNGSYNTVTGSILHDVDYMGSYASAVQIVGQHETITHNTMYRLGRSGINDAASVGGLSMQGNVVSYNDVSDFGRISTDTGAIYSCCKADLTGGSIDHNWVHGYHPPALVSPHIGPGIYLDNDTGNGLVADNVGWDLVQGTVVLNSVTGASRGNKVYNNDGGVQIRGASDASGSVMENNLGGATCLTTSIGGGCAGAVIDHNLDATVDPLYVDPANADYRLQYGSPARNAGVTVAGITDGSTDPVPSLGAYQYGGTRWVPGATLQIASPAPGTVVSGSVPVQVNLYGTDIQAYNLRIDSAGLDYAWHPQAGIRTFTLNTSSLAAGDHTLLATMVDGSGHKSTTTQRITVSS
jgi:hypothetical protein